MNFEFLELRASADHINAEMWKKCDETFDLTQFTARANFIAEFLAFILHNLTFVLPHV